MSSLLKLDWYDLVKGAIVASLTAVLGSIYAILQTGLVPTLAELKTICIAWIGAGLAYLIKNLLTNSNGLFLIKEDVLPTKTQSE